MGVLLAFAVGYVVGARAGEEGYQDVVDAISAIRRSEEFQAFVDALRRHAGATLEQLAQRLSSDGEPLSVEDVLGRARQLIDRATSSGS